MGLVGCVDRGGRKNSGEGRGKVGGRNETLVRKTLEEKAFGAASGAQGMQGGGGGARSESGSKSNGIIMGEAPSKGSILEMDVLSVRLGSRETLAEILAEERSRQKICEFRQKIFFFLVASDLNSLILKLKEMKEIDRKFLK